MNISKLFVPSLSVIPWALVAVCVTAGCSGSDNQSTDIFDGGGGADAMPDVSKDSKPDSTDAQARPDGIVVVDTGGGKCKTGESCGDGGVCAGGECCEAKYACGEQCCSGSQVCSFQTCVEPGNTCNDDVDCEDGYYCDYSLGETKEDPGGECVGGKNRVSGKCLPQPPMCPDGTEPPTGEDPITCLTQCEYRPAKNFEVELKYSWGGQVTKPTETDVMMSPIVIQLDDDDCDERITSNDIPEIVFVTFANGKYNEIGTVRAISIVNGVVKEKWTRPDVISASSELAAGNIDGEPGNEIVGCGAGNVVALNGDGTVLWTSKPVGRCRIPIIADVDADGQPEVIAGDAMLNGKTGEKIVALNPPSIEWTAADLDGDGKQEIISSRTVLSHTGALLADTGKPASFVALGDFDVDGNPEIVSMDSANHAMWVWAYDPSAADGSNIRWVRKGPLDINQSLDPNLCPDWSAGRKSGGGPVTIANFNADNIPDVALAGGVGYVILDGKKLVDPAIPDNEVELWVKVTQDCSSARTGSSIFDFDGDGEAEVVYSDEVRFRIYEGKTGAELFSICNTTGTLFEFPVVADVDNDGQADIIVVSNAYSGFICDGQKNSGVRIFGSKGGNFVKTRRVWNQHGYTVTNIEEDGTVPRVPKQNWKVAGLNNFRQNKQPGGEFNAPDVVVSAGILCVSPTTVTATVRNVGSAPVPAGLTVTFYEGESGSGSELGTATTTTSLSSAQSQVVTLTLGDDKSYLKNGSATVYATVSVPDNAHECRPDNNTSKAVAANCEIVR